MPKLIPLSSKKMKEMGIVQSKNGFMMKVVMPKPIAKPKDISTKNKKEIKGEVKNEKQKESSKDYKSKNVKDEVREVKKSNPVRIDSPAKKSINKEESARLEARGVYR